MRVTNARNKPMPDGWRDASEKLLKEGFSVNHIARKIGIRNGNPIQTWLKTQRTDLLSIARENGKRAQSGTTRIK